MTSGASRLELQSSILCAALRQSWADTDAPGMVKACQELYQLFPDLLPAPKSEQKGMPDNFYELLEIECDVNPSMVIAAYFKALKRLLRVSVNPKDVQQDFFRLLNAGFILRKARLRLSHDLTVARGYLAASQVIADDGTLEVKEAASTSLDVETSPVEILSTQPEQETLPMLIDLLKQAQFIGPAEVQALKNQMSLYPDIPLVDLVLLSGYVTDLELKALNLAEYLLTSGKITIGQFTGAMFYMRNHPPEPGEDFLPPGWGGIDSSRVPRRPIPSSWTGGIALPLPEPDEATDENNE